MSEFVNLNHVDTDVTVGEIAYISHIKRAKGFAFSRPLQMHYIIAIILSGEAEYGFSAKTHIAKAGDIVFLNKKEAYSLRVISEEPWEHIVIAFHGENMEYLPVQVFHKTAHFNRFAELFRDALQTWLGCGAAYKIKAKAIITKILYELTVESLDHLFGDNATLKKVTDYMDEHYSQKITVDELAALSGYSVSHFTREFRNSYGISPIQYLNHIRITHAKNLLRAEQYTITQIARECGFSNVYYFSAYFKKVTGLSPKEY